MLRISRVETEKVYLKLALAAGLIGLLFYLASFKFVSSKPPIKNVSASTLSPISCTQNSSSIALNQNPPDSCLFTGCSGFFQ